MVYPIPEGQERTGDEVVGSAQPRPTQRGQVCSGLAKIEARPAADIAQSWKARQPRVLSQRCAGGDLIADGKRSDLRTSPQAQVQDVAFSRIDHSTPGVQSPDHEIQFFSGGEEWRTRAEKGVEPAQTLELSPPDGKVGADAETCSRRRQFPLDDAAAWFE